MRVLLDRLQVALDHAWVPAHASEYLDGELRPRGIARVERHMARCHPAGFSDDALVRQARAGHAVAFEELVTRHSDGLCAALRRMGLDDPEAQEVAQDAFLRAWRGLCHFQGRSSFFTWLYRIAFNEAQRRLARDPGPGSTLSVEALCVEQLVDDQPGPAARAETGELMQALQQALLALPVTLRAPVLLRDVEGLSIRRAATILDLREAAFKSRLHRGRIALRRLLEPLLSSDAQD